jgi:molybdenum cofactor synthesis domain-containing protein
VSDRVSRGLMEDRGGPLLRELLEAAGIEVVRTGVVADDANRIAATLMDWTPECDIILTTGGTGLAPRDVTPEATRRVIEREAPGIAELLRWTGYQKNPRAVLSRGVAGLRERTLIVNLPGSTSAVREGMEVLLPLLEHAVQILTDSPTDH